MTDALLSENHRCNKIIVTAKVNSRRKRSADQINGDGATDASDGNGEDNDDNNIDDKENSYSFLGGDTENTPALSSPLSPSQLPPGTRTLETGSLYSPLLHDEALGAWSPLHQQGDESEN